MTAPIAYSLARQGSERVAANFLVREFACRDGSDTILIHPDLPPLLQAIRDYVAAPLHITSAYRTPGWNRRVGGEENSYHLRGMAADITATGLSPVQIYRAIENGWVSAVNPEKIGMGLYIKQGFVHVDVRGRRARW